MLGSDAGESYSASGEVVSSFWGGMKALSWIRLNR